MGLKSFSLLALVGGSSSRTASSSRNSTTANNKVLVFSVTLAASSSAIAVYATWRLLRWRARKRVRNSVERVENLLSEGPLIDYNDPQLRHRILTAAMKRASKWISLSQNQAAKEKMVGQVGGISKHKRPILSLQPDYVLKPLQTDHRGIRELAFYEALHLVASKSSPTRSASSSFRAPTKASKNTKNNSAGGGGGSGSKVSGGTNSNNSAKNNQKNAYATFLAGGLRTGDGNSSQQQGRNAAARVLQYCGEVLDMLAVAAAMVWNDPVVTGSEEALKVAWRNVQREVDALAKLTKFTAPYYGLLGQRRPASTTAFGITGDAHLLLHDLTNTFSKPCVIDLKMGSQTYEPDAPMEKQQRELTKYPPQEEFGLRVVGMRFYEPASPQADENGYVFFSKQFGRSLRTREDLLEALRRFFSANGSSSNSIGSSPKEEEEPDALQTENGNSSNLKKPNRRVTTKTKTTTGGLLRTKSIANLILQVRSLRRWFDDNGSTLQFYASSLLIVYEGETTSSSSPSSASGSAAVTVQDSGVVSLKMIDFGRVRRRRPSTTTGGATGSGSKSSNGSSADKNNKNHVNTTIRDEGYRRGLRTLHHLLTDLLQEEELRQQQQQQQQQLTAPGTPTPRTPPRRQGSADYIV